MARRFSGRCFICPLQTPIPQRSQRVSAFGARRVEILSKVPSRSSNRARRERVYPGHEPIARVER
eukprot:610226-Prorocentrum_minimum.AAC.1